MIAIVIILLLLVGGAILFVYGLFKAFEPQTPQDQLKEFAANLMHYEFGEGYEVVNTKSQNNHPDRPQNLVIKDHPTFRVIKSI